MTKIIQNIYLKTRSEWREWLRQNHEGKPGICLVFYKKATGEPTLEYGESVEEAPCFGWVDNIIKKLDDKRYVRKFTPRRPDSRWSDSNKNRVEKLIRPGLMAPAGLKKIEFAKSSGMWNKSHRQKISTAIPPDFPLALNQSPNVLPFYRQLAPSYQKQYIGWILAAKRSETKIRRITEAVLLLENGERLGMK